jgi:hypothetical protein
MADSTVVRRRRHLQCLRRGGPWSEDTSEIASCAESAGGRARGRCQLRDDDHNTPPRRDEQRGLSQVAARPHGQRWERPVELLLDASYRAARTYGTLSEMRR